MLNFNRNDRTPDPKDSGKFALKPALYEPPASTPSSAATGTPRAAATPAATPAPASPSSSSPAPSHAAPAASREASAAPTMSAPAASAPAVATTPASIHDVPAGSKLAVGINIKLRGVEISDCDSLVIEGLVEATIHSKVMEIAKPGKLTGTANIDIAEIHGDFSGELTARTRLVVHGTGRVSGTIRYGKLVVAEGGELSGDVKRLEQAQSQGQAPGTSNAKPETRPQPANVGVARSA